MTTAAKKARIDRKPCPYGAVCYRKNPVHFQEFSHPGDKDHDSGKATATLSTPTPALSLFSVTPASTSSTLPVCKYGYSCKRKNLLHFAEYQHPYNFGATTPANAGFAFGGGLFGAAAPAADDCVDDGIDTDVVDSDEEKEKKKEKTDGKDSEILSRGMSLVKSFSQMTDKERKELIQKAFEAKQQLQQELEATKKQVEEKEKQLDTLNEELKTGTLLVDGEKEALEGTETVYFPLAAERHYKEGSAAQVHFRLAESQFYRLVQGNAMGHGGYRVTKVEYVVTPHLVKRFRAAQEELRKKRGEEWSAPVLGFHGTKEEYYSSICETGFRVPGEDGFQHKTDTGYYGAGVYFSEYPSYCMGYIQGGVRLLLCQVLLGLPYQCTKLIMGAKLKAGYDSHLSPDKKELVVFKSSHILPCYLVYYTTAIGAQFSYKKARLSRRRRKVAKGDDAPILNTGSIFQKRMIANNASLTNAFDGVTFRYVGPEGESKNLFKLISGHKGKRGTGYKFDVVVAMPGVTEEKSKLVQKALEKDLPIVREEFIYECIMHKKYLDPDYFLHEVYDQ